ncbi:DUF4377 domain-containing protein [Nocardia mexicana]|uniref:Uncharacterized protein DUF4377 n=1 Tax=Nocardia mexicana TaxID=279262 RepID=A0A370GCH5_9NOCA|nr:DUF4377 domain-containing protein [Nocardia mexicana]RDI41532.1 uncharacterized protein DUF4377 [Nocardia mexicana]
MRLRLAVASALMLIPVIGCAATGESGSSPTSSPAVGEVIDLYVAEQTRPCTGVAPQTCLQVRRDPNAPWELFYDRIEGFDHQPGYRYHLQVEKRPVLDPPADASTVSWRLVRVVEQQPA